MSHDWLANPEAVAHIKRLLLQTGAPLESRVARICANTDVWFQHHGFENLAVSSGRLVYGNTQADTPLREVDQGITVQSFLDVAEEDAYGVLSLELQVLIECKHRDGLAVFGFPYQARNRRSATHPILCEFAFAPFIQAIDQEVPVLQHEPLCTIGLLDNMHKVPRVSDEHLLYKAGASLYDFIRFDSFPRIAPFVDPVVEQMGLIDRFKEARTEESFDGWSDVERWMHRHLSEDHYTEFYTRHGEGFVHPLPAVTVFVPLICVDAPLYVTEVDDRGDIQAITPKAYLLSALRVPKWPSIFHPYLARSTPEALVTIVNSEHLGSFLETIATWLSELGGFLQRIDEQEMRKAVVQRHVMQSLLSTMEYGSHEDGVWRI